MEHRYALFSAKCDTSASTIQGIGLFAKEAISQGEVVAVLGGDIITAEQSLMFPRSISDNFVQIYDDVYIGIPHLKSYGINHSCDPNIGVQGQMIFIARRNIAAGEELCFDYETTETSDGIWSINCCCGSKECRGYIDGTSWKDPAFQKRNAGYFSWHVQRKIDALRKEDV